MKRYGNLYDQMLYQEHIDKSIIRMLIHKNGRAEPGTQAYTILHNIDYYRGLTYEILKNRTFKPSRPRIFEIADGRNKKIRTIQAPRLFPDQVIHWSVMLVLQPIFMKGMDDYCCASIPERGTLYAAKQINKRLNIDRHPKYKQKYKYYLQCDIRKFFDSINREILMQKLKHIIKDPEMLKILSDIIYSVPGKVGIPLGYYTSQWFANFYLQDFDRYIREVLFKKYDGCDFMIRYMDDIILMGSNKRHMEFIYKEMQRYLNETTGLVFKEGSKVISVEDEPIDFIGFQFSYNKTIIRNGIFRHIMDVNQSLKDSKWRRKELMSMASLHGYVVNSDSYKFEIEKLIPIKLICKSIGESAKKYRIKNANKLNELIEIKQVIRDIKQEDPDPGAILVRFKKELKMAKISSRCTIEVPHDPSLTDQVDQMYYSDGRIKFSHPYWRVKYGLEKYINPIPEINHGIMKSKKPKHKNLVKKLKKEYAKNTK